jgi:hypothetical protein
LLQSKEIAEENSVFFQRKFLDIAKMACRRSISPEPKEKDYAEVTVTCPYTSEEAPTLVLLDSEVNQVLSCTMKKNSQE